MDTGAPLKRNYARKITQTSFRVLDACLKVPKLYEGSCIRELVANGLKLEPRTQGWINSEEFLSKLGA
jgi:hypothetical protein